MSSKTVYSASGSPLRRSLMLASPYLPALLALVRRSHTSSTNTATEMTAYSADVRVSAFILLHYFVVEGFVVVCILRCHKAQFQLIKLRNFIGLIVKFSRKS